MLIGTPQGRDACKRKLECNNQDMNYPQILIMLTAHSTFQVDA